jgi:hypothetical protein
MALAPGCGGRDIKYRGASLPKKSVGSAMNAYKEPSSQPWSRTYTHCSNERFLHHLSAQVKCQLSGVVDGEPNDRIADLGV